MARRRRDQAPTLTAAATRVNLRKIAEKAGSAPRSGGVSGGWQSEAWDFFESTPELGFACNFTGNAMAKLRLYAATIPPNAPPDADPIPVDDEDAQLSPALVAFAQREVARIRSLSGGQSEIMRELTINLEVAAEANLIAWAERPLPSDPPGTEPQPEQWEIRSRDEVEIRDGRLWVKDDPDQRAEDQRALDPEEDACIRIWQRHPRWSGRTWCLLRSCLGELRLLTLLSGQLLAESASRHNAGIVVIPSEIEIEKRPVLDPESGEPLAQKAFIDEFADALIEPIGDPTSPTSVVPILLRGRADLISKIQHISLTRDSTDTDAKIDKRIERLARGLNLPVEVIMGHMQTTFANAEQIDEDVFDDYLEPRATLLAQALTYAHLQPACREAFPTDPAVDRVFVWYDASDLISSPDTTEGADAAYDRGEINGAAYRKAKGFDEADAPDADEQLRRLAFRGFAAPPPEIMVAILQKLGIDLPVAAGTEALTPPTVAPSLDPAPEAIAAAALWLQRNPLFEQRARDVFAAALPASATPAPRKRTTTLGSQLVAIDRDLRARLMVLADLTMKRALERAGNRLSNKAAGSDKTALARLPAHERFASPIGKRLVAAAHIDVDEILAGSFDEMREQYMAWGAAAQRDALDAVSKAVSGLSSARRSTLQLRQAADLNESFTWLQDTLTKLAKARLFDPAAPLATEGELAAASDVPPGILRTAMAKAGGATGLHVDERGGVWLPVGNGGRQPAGGIGTGELITDAAVEAGAARQGYRWVYGPAARSRPFEPHVELDGVEFENFDDPALANTDSFPEFAFYIPGDHAGCICDFEPILLSS